ncbi:MAG: chromosome segregation protein SMC [Candidatus Lokiarchaeota archaeon]|nr:chromosome segregation protein SMC [Candidatus Lokiarchaeota archaeon]
MATKPILERIILHNFNSFAVDEVPFHKGFTVITGPNGAGKSTIFQGIKFSLGSNEKDGRAKTWSEFIRIGQEAGYAEIHLRNKKTLIKIRRTIFKGQSPFYQIQIGADSKLKKCTASTVQNLLADFGVNPDNVFAFVSQGNITNIKNMEKMQICDYLERGLGLHPLREEIIENKTTINDLDNQIKSLNLMDKSAKYEIGLLAPQVVRLKEKKELEIQREQFEKERTWLNRVMILEEIKNIRTEIGNYEQNIDSLEDDKEKIEGTIQNLEAMIKENTTIITELSQTLLDEKVKERNLDAEISRWQSDKDNLADKILRAKSKIKLLTAEKQRFTEEQKICLSEIKKYKFEFSVLQEQRKALMDEFESHQRTKKKFHDIMEYYENLKKKKSEIEYKTKENDLQLEAIERDIKNSMSEIRYLKQELEKDKWFLQEPEKNTLESLNKKKQKIFFALEKLSQNISQKENENRDLEKQLEHLKSSVLMKEMPKSQNLINLIQEIQTRNLDVIGPIIDFIEFNPEISLAVDSILSKYVLNSFIAKNKQDFMLVHDLIKRTGARCNIYQPFDREIRSYKEIVKEDGVFGYLSNFITPLSHHDDVKKVLVSICRNTVLVNDRSVGYDFINQHNHKGRVVALDGTVIRSYEYVLESRASDSGKSYSNPIEQKRAVKKLHDQLMENRGKIDEYRQQFTKLERASKLYEERLQKINIITYNYKKLTITINKKDSLLETKSNLIANSDSFLEKLNSIQNEIIQVQEKLPANLDEMDAFIEEFQVKFEGLDNKIQEMNNNLTNKTQEENLYTLKIENYSTELKAHEMELEKYEDKLKSGNTRMLQAINELERLRNSIESITREQLTLNDKNIKIQEVIQTEHDNLNSIIQTIDRIKIKIEYSEAQIYEKQKMVDNISIEVAELGKDYQERSVEEVENDLKVIYEKLRDYYDVTDQILERKKELEQQLKRSAQKKKQLEIEIKEAHISVEKLQEQYFSLFRGHLRTIENNINSRFQKIGINRKGSLNLTDKFEALGVDIHVHFNEASRSLSTLSGGEQTLFAITLMLTLQNLNPSPLCIFDEAQMFLDKSNTENVSKLIKDVTDNGVQFIMITPNASSTLVDLADCVLGIAKNGSEEVSTVIPL